MAGRTPQPAKPRPRPDPRPDFRLDDGLDGLLAMSAAYDLLESAVAIFDAAATLRYGNGAFTNFNHAVRDSVENLARPSLLDCPEFKSWLHAALNAGRTAELRQVFHYGPRMRVELTVCARPVAAAGGKAQGMLLTLGEESVAFANRHLARMQESIGALAERIKVLDRGRINSDKLVRMLLADAPFAMVLFNAKRNIVQVNRAAERLFGNTAAGMIGQSCEQLLPCYRQCGACPALDQHRDIDAEEIMGVTQDRRSVPLLRSVITVPDDQNGPLVVEAFLDMTERKLAETDLRIAATAFESLEPMLITDANGVIQRVNKAFTESTGYTAEEAVGQTPRLLKSGRHDADFYRKIWDALARTGTWQGEIWDRRKNGEVFPKWLTISAVKGADGAITHYVGAHIDITERKAAEEKIQQLAFHDPLTRLPNRQLLLDRLHQALASSARTAKLGALLFIDLDNFKTLNDTLGHVMGDMLLQQVAEKLVTCVRDGDTVARLGGDEFVVMLEDLSEQAIEAAEQAETTGGKILAVLNRPYHLGTSDVHSSGSIGVTLFSGTRQDAEELLKQADIAMYQAKRGGRNALRFFDPQMQEAINTRAAIEAELHKAIAKRQFQLYYQIQVDKLRRPLGAEALLRWMHPQRGLVSPAQFIPLAEETGLILPIGRWVLDAACAQLKAFERSDHARGLVLSVNISARQFHQPDFVAQVRAAIERHAIDPSLLKLELTESLMLDHHADTVAAMNALKAIGVGLSMDDFGTGYSSLQYLKLLPLDQIKIDQSFVRDITTDANDATIVQTIIAMGEALGLDVIAEGVETDAQFEFLDLRGCHAYQGFLFGKPAPIEQFEKLLKP